jgi:hypothetical protein
MEAMRAGRKETKKEKGDEEELEIRTRCNGYLPAATSLQDPSALKQSG